MADGTVSMADGLGLKALDSHELRRRQHLLDPKEKTQIQTPLQPQLENPRSPTLFEHHTPSRPISDESNLRFTSTGTVLTSTSTGFGAHSPTSSKNPNSSRILQQAFMEESLKLEAQRRAIHPLGNAHLPECQLDKVQNSTPTPKILFNTRGIPYVEGDPTLGFPLKDTKPRYTLSHSNSGTVSDSSINELGLDLKLCSQIPQLPPLNASSSQPQCAPASQHQQKTTSHPQPPRTHQPNPNPNTGQNKPKPKNWASLLQSQSPSSDMKLEYFPDLQKGKEALVEIDVELTQVGKWNRYLIGHFLDGKMAYPLLVSTARRQWKELFVAVKPDVSGFYLFEFRDEQAKVQVLEGGPYFFSQKYLVLKEWHRMMKPLQDQPTKIPAWVKFHDLPLELWNQECLSRVASTVGRPIHVDQATARTSKQPGLLHTKSTKARICIEICAEQELPDEVIVSVQGETVVVPIEYQVLPPMCSYCHVFGHTTSKCIMHTDVVPPSPPKDLGWQVVNNGKHKVVDQSSPHKSAQPLQNRPSPVLSIVTPSDLSISHKQTQVGGLPKMEWQPVINRSSISSLGGSAALDVVTTPVVAEVRTSIPQVSVEDMIGSDDSDSETELLEVLEGVVNSVVTNPQKFIPPSSSNDSKLRVNAGYEQSNQATNRAAGATSSNTKAAGSENKISQHVHKPDGEEKDPPDLVHHSDVQVLLGGSSKAGNKGNQKSHPKGNQRSQSKGSNKKRKLGLMIHLVGVLDATIGGCHSLSCEQ